MFTRVPARVGGVDLSYFEKALKQLGTVPARVGGVDLSIQQLDQVFVSHVPARVGGVDLSRDVIGWAAALAGPRPCGRGGFKLVFRVS